MVLRIRNVKVQHDTVNHDNNSSVPSVTRIFLIILSHTDQLHNPDNIFLDERASGEHHRIYKHNSPVSCYNKQVKIHLLKKGIRTVSCSCLQSCVTSEDWWGWVSWTVLSLVCPGAVSRVHSALLSLIMVSTVSVSVSRCYQQSEDVTNITLR